ncbi:MAG: radical SAM protein [Kiritimatiellia bacterium]
MKTRVPESAAPPTGYSRILQKAFDDKIPLTAHWELTYRCNLSCSHCYADRCGSVAELSTGQIIEGLRQLAAMRCLFLTFTGGEIFLRSDILDILREAKQLGFAVKLFTNGTLMDERLADAVAEIEPVGVEMTLHSMDPAVHDTITHVPGSHAAVIRALRLCRERHINITVKTLLLKSNRGAFEGVRKFTESEGARFVFDFVLVPTDTGRDTMKPYGLAEEEITEFIFSQSGGRSAAPKTPDASDPVCGAGSNTLCITPGGDVLPCLAVRRPVGNITKHPLAEIWRSPMLDPYRNMRYIDIPECRNCEYVVYCARCPGVALAECGSVTGKSPSACVAARAAARAAERTGKKQSVVS